MCALVLIAGVARADDSEDCATCHDQLVQSFKATIHGQIRGFETPDGVTGCVTCHGDGTAHMDSGGEEAGSIRSLNADMPAVEVGDVCMTCHRSHALNDWNGSVHALNDVGCTDCHTVHQLAEHTVAGDATPGWERQISPALVRGGADPVVCLDCHTEVRAQLQYPSHHPVREGHMNCGSCHDPHGNSLGNLNSEVSDSEMCLSCHSHLQGPFIFEHEAVTEGCDTCHTPHGSVANNLLAQNEPFICLQCHELHFHAGLEGEEDEEVYVPAYDPDFDPDNTARDTYPGGMVPNPYTGSGYKQAFTTKCTQCHAHVHGSDSPSQTVPGYGRGLTR
jgi:DmsE family decaheme c-type cytochrome